MTLMYKGDTTRMYMALLLAHENVKNSTIQIQDYGRNIIMLWYAAQLD